MFMVVSLCLVRSWAQSAHPTNAPKPKPLTNPRRCLQMSLLIVFKPLKAPLYLLIQKTLSPVISAKAEIQLVTHFFVRKNQNILFALRHKKVSGALRQNVRTGFPLSRE